MNIVSALLAGEHIHFSDCVVILANSLDNHNGMLRNRF